MVASLTTIPSRIDHIRPTVEGALRMSVLDRVNVAIPHGYVRQTSNANLIPAWLVQLADKSSKLCLVSTEDYGPSTKLLSALNSPHISNYARIITLDDDRVYDENMIKKLVDASEVHPDSVIALSGWPVTQVLKNGVSRVPEGQRGQEYVKEGYQDIVLGCAGVLYRKNFFDHKIFDYDEEFTRSCFFVDDMWISGHVERLGIKRWLVKGTDADRTQADHIDDLSSFRGNKDHHCLSAMRDRFGIFANATRH